MSQQSAPQQTNLADEVNNQQLEQTEGAALAPATETAAAPADSLPTSQHNAASLLRSPYLMKAQRMSLAETLTRQHSNQQLNRLFGGQAPAVLHREPDKNTSQPQAQAQTQPPPLDSIRQQIISIARAEVGKTDAKHGRAVNPGETDKKGNLLDSKKKVRIGWERLYEFFEVAMGGVTDNMATAIIYAPADPDNDTQLPSWCTIFDVWAIKKAGGNIPNWKLNDGIFTLIPQTIPITQVQPGDIAHRKAHDHTALVVSVDMNSRQITTLNGNTSSSNDTLHGGYIQEKTEPFDVWKDFFPLNKAKTVQPKK